MMTFEDIKYTDKKTGFVLPDEVMHHLREALEKSNVNVDYEVIHRFTINKDRKLSEKYDKFRETARKAFMENGYPDYPIRFYDVFISNIDSDYLWEKIKVCYGDNQDDYYKTHEAFPSSPLVPVEEPKDEPVILDIPITSDRFMFIGEDDEMIEFEKLMKEKNLNEDDIDLILSCVRFSFQ